jgi:hypothetical protein
MEFACLIKSIQKILPNTWYKSQGNTFPGYHKYLFFSRKVGWDGKIHPQEAYAGHS